MEDSAAFDAEKLDYAMWSDEKVFKLIELKAKYAHLFTGRRGSAASAYTKISKELGMSDFCQSVKKKWENLCDRYKKVKQSRMSVGGEFGEKPPLSWRFYSAMDAAVGQKKVVNSPIVVISGICEKRAKMQGSPAAYTAELSTNSSNCNQEQDLGSRSSWFAPEVVNEDTATTSGIANGVDEDNCNDNSASYGEQGSDSAVGGMRPRRGRRSDERVASPRKEAYRASKMDFARGIALARLKQISDSVAQDVGKVTEFDLWAKSVAFQLNAMEVTRALRLQLKLQTMITEERISHESSKQ